MADTLSRLRRTALLLPRLLRAHDASVPMELADTAEALGTDARTLTGDLTALQDIEFESDDRPNYFSFEIAGNEVRVNTVPLMLRGKPQTVRLTEPEASSLLSFLDELELGESEDEALENLELAIARAAGAPEGIRCWSAGGPIPAEEVFTAILNATREHLRCEISYTGAGGNLYAVGIEPYHLRMERGLWYAITRLAEGPHVGEKRCFRLDKIATVEVGGPFEPRPINLSKYSYGVFRPTGEPMIATVTFSDRIAAYAMERWGPGRPVADGVEVDIEYWDDGWLERTLAVFGAETVRLRSAT